MGFWGFGVLGIPERSSRIGQLGSTVMVIDPVVGPEEVCAAVERYWWPALEDHLMDVTIETESGETLVPWPKGSQVLGAVSQGLWDRHWLQQAQIGEQRAACIEQVA